MSKISCSACLLLLFNLFVPGPGGNAQRSTPNAETLREQQHQDPQWPLVQAHLPDPATASPEKLEMAADVLRARRFPQDALDYYMYALRRGGKQDVLWNKLGVVELELWNTAAARAYFKQVVRLDHKSSLGWNNLGAVEYIDGFYKRAASNYKTAIKLNKESAVFHSNLGTAYFEQKDFKKAREQYSIALQLDPTMAEHAGAMGVTAHMLSPADRARYCFEMARVYAERGDETNMLRNLTMASEAGFDVLHEMGSDEVMLRYRKDPRVLLLVRNSQALRAGHSTIATEVKGGLPPLPPQTAP